MNTTDIIIKLTAFQTEEIERITATAEEDDERTAWGHVDYRTRTLIVTDAAEAIDDIEYWATQRAEYAESYGGNESAAARSLRSVAAKIKDHPLNSAPSRNA